MPSASVAYKVTINQSLLDQLINQLTPNMEQAVDDTAHAIQERAFALAPRETGALAASIYVSTPNESDYGSHSGTAASLNPEANIVLEVTPNNAQFITGPPPDSAYVDIVGVAVEYGLYQELGTRYMAAQPYLFPSIEPEKNEFINRMSSIANV